MNAEQQGQIKGMEQLLYRQRHSAAHIMAEAVLAIFPEAKYAIGPPIWNGFYFRFLLARAPAPAGPAGPGRHLSPRWLHGPLRLPTRREHRPGRRLQAHERCRRLLARRRAPP